MRDGQNRRHRPAGTYDTRHFVRADRTATRCREHFTVMICRQTTTALK